MKLRKWQEEAIGRWEHSMKTRFLAVAPPGSGKSVVAAKIYEKLKAENPGTFLVVVVPTTQLKSQWTEVVKKHGHDITAEWKPEQDSPEHWEGIAITYAMIAQAPHQCAELLKNRPHMIILDEVHRIGDNNGWGAAVTAVTSEARNIVALSATPFRGDGDSIPYIDYDSNGICIPDYEYARDRAITDGVCLPRNFVAVDTEASWTDNNGKHSAWMSELNDKKDVAGSIASALHSDSQWTADVAKAAVDDLRRRRESRPDAGGLIVCTDRKSAYAWQKLLREKHNTVAHVVLGDDPAAWRTIEEFRSDRSPWLIAVHLVTEGVDITRLEVLVYATAVRDSVRYVEQAWGRVSRRRRGDKRTPATVYFPNCEPFHRVVVAAGQPSDFQSLSETGTSRSSQDREYNRPFAHPSRQSRIELIDSEAPPSGDDDESDLLLTSKQRKTFTKDKDLRQLRRTLNTLVTTYARMVGSKRTTSQAIYSRINNEVGDGASTSTADREILMGRIQLVNELIDRKRSKL